MPGFRRRYSRPRRFTRRPRRAASRRPKVSKGIKSYVKKAIHRQIENKQYMDKSANNTVTTASSNGTPNGKQLIPGLTAGTTNYQRIGDVVKIVKGQAKMTVNLLPYNATTNALSTPVIVKVFILRALDYNATQASYSTYSWSELFRGNNGNYGFSNSPIDFLAPINNDKWRLLTSRTFKLGAASATSTGQVGTGGYYDNSPMSKTLTINWGKYVRKQLKFGTDNNCQNDNCIMAIQAVYADGSASASQAVEYHWHNQVVFEDA